MQYLITIWYKSHVHANVSKGDDAFLTYQKFCKWMIEDKTDFYRKVVLSELLDTFDSKVISVFDNKFL